MARLGLQTLRPARVADPASRTSALQGHLRHPPLLHGLTAARGVVTGAAIGWFAWRVDGAVALADRKSTRLNSSHHSISYAVFCLKKKNKAGKLETADTGESTKGIHARRHTAT